MDEDKQFWYILILAISLISVVAITVTVIEFTIINDYVIYDLQNITETLEGSGLLKNGTSAITQQWGDQYTNFNFHIDDIWFLFYATFVIASLSAAYKSKPTNYFSFLAFLFYGIMFLLFLLSLFTILSDWWYTDILLKIVPNLVLNFPKFSFYLNNIGIFSALHIIISLIINLFDFDFAKINLTKKKEQQTLQDDEVI